MAENSRPFESTRDDRRRYSSADWARVFNTFLNDGYVQGFDGELKVVAAADMSVEVSTGRAMVQGRYYENTSPLQLTHDPADPSNPRIDRVVLRRDLSTNERSVKAVILKGTPASTPSPPSLTRNGTIWELSLAQVLIPAGATSTGTITDERDDPDVCGPALPPGVTPRDDIGITFIIDGGGAEIDTGSKGHVVVPWSFHLDEVIYLADTSGDISIRIDKMTFADYPSSQTLVHTGSLSSADKDSFSEDIDIDQNDILEFEVTSASVDITRVSISLRGTKK